MARPRRPKSSIVPRAVFAVAVALGTVPSAAACTPEAAPTGRSAQLRPSGPPRSPAPARVAAAPDLGTDAGADLGTDAGQREVRSHRKRVPPPRNPLWYGVALGVAAFSVAMTMQ